MASTGYAPSADELNQFGELGSLSSPAMQKVDANAWAQVATSRHHTCGIGRDGKVYCWGLNKWGELGSGPHYHDTPVAVSPPAQ